MQQAMVLNPNDMNASIYNSFLKLRLTHVNLSFGLTHLWGCFSTWPDPYPAHHIILLDW